MIFVASDVTGLDISKWQTITRLCVGSAVSDFAIEFGNRLKFIIFTVHIVNRMRLISGFLSRNRFHYAYAPP